MSNNEEDQSKAFVQAVQTVWQMDKEMETVLDGLRNERESLIGDIRIANTKGICSKWIMGEMLGIDKAIALLTPIEVDTESH